MEFEFVMAGNLRKLTQDEYIALENLMQEVPDPNETFSATGMHYELAALLIKFGFRPIGRYEAYKMGMDLLEQGYDGQT